MSSAVAAMSELNKSILDYYGETFEYKKHVEQELEVLKRYMNILEKFNDRLS